MYRYSSRLPTIGPAVAWPVPGSARAEVAPSLVHVAYHGRSSQATHAVRRASIMLQWYLLNSQPRAASKVCAQRIVFVRVVGCTMQVDDDREAKSPTHTKAMFIRGRLRQIRGETIPSDPARSARSRISRPQQAPTAQQRACEGCRWGPDQVFINKALWCALLTHSPASLSKLDHRFSHSTWIKPLVTLEPLFTASATPACFPSLGQSLIRNL